MRPALRSCGIDELLSMEGSCEHPGCKQSTSSGSKSAIFIARPDIIRIFAGAATRLGGFLNATLTGAMLFVTCAVSSAQTSTSPARMRPPPRSDPPAVAAPRTDPNPVIAHQQLVAKAKAGGIDLYFLGDSITR